MEILPPPAKSPSVARDRREGIHGAGDLQDRGGSIEVGVKSLVRRGGNGQICAWMVKSG